jgi:hypothetical protein
MYYLFPCALPLVVFVCFMFRTWYTVSYIACMARYPVPQSEYRLCSPSLTLFPFEFDSPHASHPSVLPRAGLGQAGFVSGSETTRKPLVLLFISCSPQLET